MARPVTQTFISGDTTYRICGACRSVLPLSDYYSIKYYNCKQCHVEYVKETQRKNSAHYEHYRKRYAELNPEKVVMWEIASELNHQITYSGMTKFELLKSDPIKHEQYLEGRRKWAKKNRSRINKKRKHWYYTEKAKANRKEWYAKNRERILLNAKNKLIQSKKMK